VPACQIASVEGPVPFQPWRDLTGVARLLAATFGPAAEPERSAFASMLRWWKLWPASIWILTGPETWAPGGLSRFVCHQDGKVVGTANIAPEESIEGLWVLSNVAVAPSHRGQGIGRRLVRACLDYAAGHGARLVQLHVWASNEPAVRLYASEGFTVSTSRQCLRFDPAPGAEQACHSFEEGHWRPARGPDLEALARLLKGLAGPRRSAFGWEAGAWCLRPRSLLARLSGQLQYVFCRDGLVLAGIVATRRSRRHWQILPLCPPEQAAALAWPLAAEARTIAQALQPAHVAAEVSERFPDLVSALEGVGFVRSDALLLMERQFPNPYRKAILLPQGELC
jgi:ribosomal protein S18 acetylase RimI-like enzyme